MLFVERNKKTSKFSWEHVKKMNLLLNRLYPLTILSNHLKQIESNLKSRTFISEEIIYTSIINLIRGKKRNVCLAKPNL